MARGRLLLAPPGARTRPTGDRVREAIFDTLTSMGAVEGASVLDLFAGSGALGIEAMSRGAGAAVLVDESAPALAAMTANVAVLGGAAQHVRIVRAESLSYARGMGSVDLVFADPPYGYPAWPSLLRALHGRTALLVAETASADPAPAGSGDAGWETVKVKRYGGTVVYIAQPDASLSAPNEPGGPAEEGEC
jgi:16S rRNA (guanine966-N2)-methyltransferase